MDSLVPILIDEREFVDPCDLLQELERLLAEGEEEKALTLLRDHFQSTRNKGNSK